MTRYKNKMQAKKAQVKMFETIAVVIVFFFFLIFGLVYYNSTQTKQIAAMADEDKQLRSIEIMKVATYLPELQCSTDNVLTPNCLDLTKLQSFGDISAANKVYYSNLFSYGKIYVEQIYPTDETWTIYLNPKAGSKSSIPNFIPILIYDPVSLRYRAAILVAEVQS
jgi:hypothetical protein